jgi:hypothetical protein
MPGTYSADGGIGKTYSKRTLNAEFKLGTPSLSDQNDTFVYVQAPALIAAAATCTVSQATFIAASGAGTYTADTAFAAGEFGWVRKTTTPL